MKMKLGIKNINLGNNIQEEMNRKGRANKVNIKGKKKGGKVHFAVLIEWNKIRYTEGKKNKRSMKDKKKEKKEFLIQ